jgi:hypothetical protein
MANAVYQFQGRTELVQGQPDLDSKAKYKIRSRQRRQRGETRQEDREERQSKKTARRGGLEEGHEEERPGCEKTRRLMTHLAFKTDLITGEVPAHCLEGDTGMRRLRDRAFAL